MSKTVSGEIGKGKKGTVEIETQTRHSSGLAGSVEEAVLSEAAVLPTLAAATPAAVGREETGKNKKHKKQMDIITPTEAKSRLRTKLAASMKAGDKTASETIRSIINELENQEKAPGGKSDVVTALKRMVNQRKASADAFKSAGEVERANQEMAELLVIEAFSSEVLPPQMSEEDIETEVRSIMAELSPNASGQKLSGMTMGEFQKRNRGKADAGVVKSIVDRVAAE